MHSKKKISVIFGTRPEAIKLAPVILALRKETWCDCQVCVTGQHRQMLDQVLEVFDIVPDKDLDLMQPNQSLGGLTARSIQAIDAYLAAEKPDLVLVQGDTTTVFCAALAAFYHHIPIGHVEAGLRTGNMQAPWPEEANRVLTSRLAALHFAPTETSRQNLLKEGVLSEHIHVTGNTVIDALFLALEKVKREQTNIPNLPDFLQPTPPQSQVSTVTPLVLITGHRRENFGKGFENICIAIARLAEKFPSVHFVYPVHLNPNVCEPVYRILGLGMSRESTTTRKLSALNSQLSTCSALLPNVHLIEPLPYLPFVALMNRASVILTDSGGVQEEAPSLGKPVLVMRDTTERPEAVQMGTVKLVGADSTAIVNNVSTLLTDVAAYNRMANAVNPYGDGKSVSRIVGVCAQALAQNNG